MSEFTELDSLKEIADNKGVSYHPKIGADALKQKIKDFDLEMEAKQSAKRAPSVNSEMERRKELEKDALALVRVRINCMNPNKREWSGEWLSAGNSVLGFHTKYVAYDREYHLTRMMVNILESKRFRVSRDESDGKGGKVRKNFFPKEYNIEYLPALTREELDALAADQAKRQAID